MRSSIKLKNVTIDFPVFGANTRSIKNKLLSTYKKNNIQKKSDNSISIIRALNNISFTLSDGDTVGLIGANGAGKSTLLRVLTNVYEPVYGTVEICGKITSLIDFNMGLDVESTGIENIKLLSLLQGQEMTNIDSSIDYIAEFSGLGEYINMPVRSYSSGMQLRLAFSIATNIVPEILILDEVVNVGDANFINSTRKKINEIMESSKIVVLASHEPSLIQSICNKVIWLDNGELKFIGGTKEGLDRYFKSV